MLDPDDDKSQDDDPQIGEYKQGEYKQGTTDRSGAQDDESR